MKKTSCNLLYSRASRRTIGSHRVSQETSVVDDHLRSRTALLFYGMRCYRRQPFVSGRESTCEESASPACGLRRSRCAQRMRQDVNRYDKDIESALRRAVADEVGSERFDLWFGAGVQLRLSGDEVEVAASDQFTLDRLRRLIPCGLVGSRRESLRPPGVSAFRSRGSRHAGHGTSNGRVGRSSTNRVTSRGQQQLIYSATVFPFR